MNDYSTCFTKAEEFLKDAYNQLALRNFKEGVKALTKAQQWLSESHNSISEEQRK